MRDRLGRRKWSIANFRDVIAVKDVIDVRRILKLIQGRIEHVEISLHHQVGCGEWAAGRLEPVMQRPSKAFRLNEAQLLHNQMHRRRLQVSQIQRLRRRIERLGIRGKFTQSRAVTGDVGQAIENTEGRIAIRRPRQAKEAKKIGVIGIIYVRRIAAILLADIMRASNILIKRRATDLASLNISERIANGDHLPRLTTGTRGQRARQGETKGLVGSKGHQCRQ